MDGNSGYNQIKVHPENKEMNAFPSPKGVFFSIKSCPLAENCKSYVFNGNDDHIQGTLVDMVNCYIDDLVFKLHQNLENLKFLEIVINRRRRSYLGQIKVRRRGFTVRQRKREVNPIRIKAITRLSPQRTYGNSKDTRLSCVY